MRFTSRYFKVTKKQNTDGGVFKDSFFVVILAGEKYYICQVYLTLQLCNLKPKDFDVTKNAKNNNSCDYIAIL